MDYPKVTIITPTYNRADLLPEVIESVLNQNYPNLQYVIVDDGSTDNTREVVTRYGSQITYVYQENKGEAGAVNTGWALAEGEFTCIINSDDPQPQGLIHRSVEVMQQNPDVIVTYPDWWWVDDDYRLRMHTMEYDYLETLRGVECAPGPGAFMRTRRVREARPYLRNQQYRVCTDFELWVNLGLYGRFLRIPEPLGRYIHHGGNQTQIHKGQLFAKETEMIFRQLFARNDLPAHVRREKRRIMAAVYAKCALWSLYSSMADALHYLKKAFREQPAYMLLFLIRRTAHELYVLGRRNLKL